MARWAPATTRRRSFRWRRSRPGGAVRFERYTRESAPGDLLRPLGGHPAAHRIHPHRALVARAHARGRAPAIELINQRGSAEGLRQELERGIETTRQPIPTSADLLLSREGRGVVARADAEAEMLKHRSIDSTHLVLGVLAMNGKGDAGSPGDRIGGVTARRWPVRRSVPALDTSGRSAGAVPEPPRDAAALGQTARPSLQAAVSKLDQLVAQTYGYVRGVNDSFGYRGSSASRGGANKRLGT
jgi:hypothetical protein